MSDLSDSVQFLKGVGPARAADFGALGIHTVRDLLTTYPRRIADRTEFSSIAEAGEQLGAEVSLRVSVIDSRTRRIRGGRQLTTATFSDDTGELEGVWFNAPYIEDRLEAGEVLICGKVDFKGGRLQMAHPRVELLDDEGTGETIGCRTPVYPLTGRLNQNAWRKAMRSALERYGSMLEEFYPDAFLEERQLMTLPDAVANMHFPESDTAEAKARERLVYDECLLLQLGVLFRRHHVGELHDGRALSISGAVEERIRALFPFQLTRAQQEAVAEILNDLRKPVAMHRLLQGDVGSGKTAVAFYAMLATVAAGAQVVIMAPTEILARQHERTFAQFLANSPRSRVRVALLTGSMKAAERKALLTGVGGGAVDVLIGTHAAIQDDVRFRDLALVVIDEQHKFGVEQRLRLARKGRRPHVLVMTATPIPRSLAMTLYGDLDVSVIRGLPPGRKAVDTRVPEPANWPKVYDFLRQRLREGRQAYIVSPLVEESESLDLQSATEAFEHLQQEELKGFRVGLLHGKMKRDEQRAVMKLFHEGRLDVLVSTVVIEVGVDVPNATILLVLHAERFGLAQLHQLRGRIGRGTHQGYCVLMSSSRRGTAAERLQILAREQDGFAIAEADLELRGEGQFLGTRQHGHGLKLASLLEDYPIMRLARDDAKRLLKADPELSSEAHQPLREELMRLHAEALDLTRSG